MGQAQGEWRHSCVYGGCRCRGALALCVPGTGLYVPSRPYTASERAARAKRYGGPA